MIERVLGWLAGHHIDEAVLSLGYRPDAFTDAYPDGRCAGVRVVYAVESEPLGTAGAIRFAAEEAGLHETFVAVNGDVLTALDVSALVNFHQERQAEATIALTSVADPSAFGVVPTADDGRVLAFIEKPPRDQAPTNLINAGTYVLEPSVLARIPPGHPVSIELETFPALVGEGRLFAMPSEADWIDIGTPRTYLAANLVYSADPKPSGDISPDATFQTSVVAGTVSVGPGALVCQSVVMDRATIGEAAVVSSSIVGADVKIGRGARLSDLTVIGDGVTVDPESELSNQRLPSNAPPVLP
jgi:mannose-1-phosphate guanylyltransferase